MECLIVSYTLPPSSVSKWRGLRELDVPGELVLDQRLDLHQALLLRHRRDLPLVHGLLQETCEFQEKDHCFAGEQY